MIIFIQGIIMMKTQIKMTMKMKILMIRKIKKRKIKRNQKSIKEGRNAIKINILLLRMIQILIHHLKKIIL